MAFAFYNEADVQKFAAAMEAETTNNYPGWASPRAFEMDIVKVRQLGASLPQQRVKTPGPPMDRPCAFVFDVVEKRRCLCGSPSHGQTQAADAEAVISGGRRLPAAFSAATVLRDGLDLGNRSLGK